MNKVYSVYLQATFKMASDVKKVIAMAIPVHAYHKTKVLSVLSQLRGSFLISYRFFIHLAIQSQHCKIIWE